MTIPPGKDGAFSCTPCQTTLLAYEREIFVGARKVALTCPKCGEVREFTFSGSGRVQGPAEAVGPFTLHGEPLPAPGQTGDAALERVERFIARIAHQCWVSYQMALNQPTNGDPTDDQMASHVAGIREWMKNPDMTPEKNHESWMKHKLETGWKYGPVKDPVKKEHPCLVPFGELPLVEMLKDVVNLGAYKLGLELAKEARIR